MKLLIFGGSGLVGSHLAKAFINQYHDVNIVSRTPERYSSNASTRLHYVPWPQVDQNNIGYGDIDVVINLSGTSLLERYWTKRVRQELYDSRVKTTQHIVDLINRGVLFPKYYINCSAVGVYGNRFDNWVSENDAPGVDYLSEICVAWEKMLSSLKSRDVRVSIVRLGVVMSNDGGMLPKIQLLFKYYLGGIFGPGYQYLSWIHIDDLVKVFEHIFTHTSPSYCYNAVSPNAVTYADFSKMLQQHMSRPSWIRYSSFFLKFLLGERSILFLHGQRVKPSRLMNEGFQFQFPQLDNALEDLMGR